MAKDRTNAFIGGGLTDAVFMAAKGTTFPTGLAAPTTPWVELGWLGDDGLSMDPNVDRKEFKAHQGGTIIRRKVTGSGRVWSLVCLENNLPVLGLVHPGVTWVKTGTSPNQIVTGTIPEGIVTTEMAWIVDTYDGTIQQRYEFTGEATLSGAFKFGVEDMTAYEFDLASYGSPIMVTNQPGLVAAVS